METSLEQVSEVESVKYHNAGTEIAMSKMYRQLREPTFAVNS
jgi:hypothetical protein